MRVALTGGVASGKSTVARLLAELGAVVVDADRIAREVVAPGTAGLAAVVGEFGQDVLGPDGALDRAAMAARVFSDAEARRRLEAIVHPLVREEADRQERAAGPGALVVHDIPLLVETGQAGRFDAVVVVDADPADQMARMTSRRGWSEEEARSRIAAQAGRSERLAVATHVVVNDGTREELARRVREVYEQLAPPPRG